MAIGLMVLGVFNLHLQDSNCISHIAYEMVSDLSEEDYGTLHSQLVCEPDNWFVQADGTFGYGQPV